MQTDDAKLRQARQTRDWLAGRYLHLPEVTLIDVGYHTGGLGANKVLVIRIHVKDQATVERLQLPGEVNGIPIQVVIADYKLEA